MAAHIRFAAELGMHDHRRNKAIFHALILTAFSLEVIEFASHCVSPHVEFIALCPTIALWMERLADTFFHA